MDHTSYEPMETLTSVGDLTSAHLLAAHLRAEGLDVVLQGEPLGPYPVTVGRMAVTKLLVPAQDLELARELLREIERQATETEVEPAGVGLSASFGVSIVWWAVAVALLAAIIWVRVIRYL